MITGEILTNNEINNVNIISYFYCIIIYTHKNSNWFRDRDLIDYIETSSNKTKAETNKQQTRLVSEHTQDMRYTR